MRISNSSVQFLTQQRLLGLLTGHRQYRSLNLIPKHERGGPVIIPLSSLGYFGTFNKLSLYFTGSLLPSLSLSPSRQQYCLVKPPPLLDPHPLHLRTSIAPITGKADRPPNRALHHPPGTTYPIKPPRICTSSGSADPVPHQG